MVLGDGGHAGGRAIGAPSMRQACTSEGLSGRTLVPLRCCIQHRERVAQALDQLARDLVRQHVVRTRWRDGVAVEAEKEDIAIRCRAGTNRGHPAQPCRRRRVVMGWERGERDHRMQRGRPVGAKQPPFPTPPCLPRAPRPFAEARLARFGRRPWVMPPGKGTRRRARSACLVAAVLDAPASHHGACSAAMSLLKTTCVASTRSASRRISPERALSSLSA